MNWWPAILRPLVKEHGADRVRQIGEESLGYPPDVFGVTFDELRQLSAALNQS